MWFGGCSDVPWCQVVVFVLHLVTQAQFQGEKGGAYSFVACLSHLTIPLTTHASLSRRSTVPTPNRDTPDIRALITLLPYTT